MPAFSSVFAIWMRRTSPFVSRSVLSGERTPSSIRRSTYLRSIPDRLAASAREYSATRPGYGATSGLARQDEGGQAGRSERSIGRGIACSRSWWEMAERSSAVRPAAVQLGSSGLNYSGGFSVFICRGLGMHAGPQL